MRTWEGVPHVFHLFACQRSLRWMSPSSTSPPGSISAADQIAEKSARSIPRALESGG